MKSSDHNLNYGQALLDKANSTPSRDWDECRMTNRRKSRTMSLSPCA
jgi:hypothetical protein